MSTDYFIIDVSHWDPSVDWGILKSHNVLSAIVKATDGSSGVDDMFQTHCNGAKATGMVLGAYHFFRPWIDTSSIEAQAQFFLNTIANQPINFIALDLEEYVRDPTKRVTPDKYSQRANTASAYLSSHSNLPLVIYTRKSFIDSYAPQIYKWLPQFKLWLAHWRYSSADLNSGRQNTTWEDLIANHLPPYSGPTIPPGCTSWTLWQWTGEKFILPGITTPIDLNFFNGTKEEFFKWVNFTPACLGSEPGDPTLPHVVKVKAFLQVHSTPGMDPATVVGSLDNTARPTTYEICVMEGDKFVRIGDNQWIAMRYKGIIYSEWE